MELTGFSLLILVIFILENALIGAWLGRVDGGGGGIKMSEWVERTFIMLFFIIACIPFASDWAVLAYIGVAGIATGHGSYFPSRAVKAVAPEFFDFIVRPLFGSDPRAVAIFFEYRDDNWRSDLAMIPGEVKAAMNKYGMKKLYWRNAFGMLVTGTLVGLPAAILAAYFGEYLFMVLFLLTGASKSVAYLTGDFLFKNTESAEWINGGLRTALCMTVLITGLFIA